MSKPILYKETEVLFDNNGLGFLSDALSVRVREKLQGLFELEMEYPVTGELFSKIQHRSLIKAKPTGNRTPQPFEVYRITKPIGGVVKIYAEHISYKMGGIVAEPFKADSASNALTYLQNSTVPKNPFKFWTDKDVKATMSVTAPESVRRLMGGVRGSIIDTYGGEWDYDNYTVKLWKHRGQDNGVSIRYGKNLTDFKQDENCANVYTAVYPFWKSYDGELVTLPEKIIKAKGTYTFERIKPLDLSAKFIDKPTEDKLRTAAQAYVDGNNIGVPKVNLKVKYISLDQTPEYTGKALLERVNLGDTVHIFFPQMQVNAKARCIETVYDVLNDRMESVELGEARASLTDTVVNQQNELDTKPSQGQVVTLSEALTRELMGSKGGAIRQLDTDGDGMPDSLFIADNPDPEKATKVWLFNQNGWGASQNGYAGPYTMGATFQNGLIADFITAGTLKSINGKTQINLDTGDADIYGNVETLGNAKLTKAHMDEEGIWIQRKDGNKRGVYINQYQEIEGNFDTLRINTDDGKSGFGDTSLLLRTDDATKNPEMWFFGKNDTVGNKSKPSVYLGYNPRNQPFMTFGNPYQIYIAFDSNNRPYINLGNPLQISAFFSAAGTPILRVGNTVLGEIYTDNMSFTKIGGKSIGWADVKDTGGTTRKVLCQI